MKIANYNGTSEKPALDNLLQNYRDTPHPSTGISPAAMIFGSSMSDAFPSRTANKDDVEAGISLDKQQKSAREDKINSSKYKKASEISIGDNVLVRNYRRRSKFQPLFIPEQYIVTGISDYGRKLNIERIADGQTLIRHPDDLKLFCLPARPAPEKTQCTSQWEVLNRQNDEVFDYDEWRASSPPPQIDPDVPTVEEEPVMPETTDEEDPLLTETAPEITHQEVRETPSEPRRSDRSRKPPERLGSVVYDEEQPLQGEDSVIPPWWPGYPREEN